MRIIFMGSPDFASGILQKLLAKKFEIVAVYSQPSRRAKRGQKLVATPVAQIANHHKIPLQTPVKLEGEALAKMQKFKADILIVVAYGLLLPNEFLTSVKYGGVNIHASLLPRFRGASPIQYAILKGDNSSGISLIQMEKGLDCGAILAQEFMDIACLTTPELHDKLQILGGKMIVDFLHKLADTGKIIGTIQKDSHSCYAPKLTRSDGYIDFMRQDALEIERKIRAFTPWPGAWFLHYRYHSKQKKWQEERLFIHQAVSLPENNLHKIGEIIGFQQGVHRGIIVQCNQGQLCITQIQRIGAKILDWKNFLHGYPLIVGERLASKPLVN